MKLTRRYRRIFWESVRLYFAPVTGAVKGICAELRRVEREMARNRRQERQAGDDLVHDA